MTTTYAPRSWCATVNNPTDDDHDLIRAAVARDAFSYLVHGREVGNNGTPHLQMYGENTKAMRFKALKQILPRAHIEPRRGKPKVAAGYCKKGTDEPPDGNWAFFFTRTVADPETWDQPFEHGTISAQGARSDLEGPTEAIVQGTPINEVARQFPEQFVKFHRGFTALAGALQQPRMLQQMPEVIVLFGKTETGKSHRAHFEYWPDLPMYKHTPANGQWWDGYDGQTKILLEEFRGGLPYAQLLLLLDKYEYRVPVKGGFTQVQADKIIICSPLPPWQWYPSLDHDDSIDQLRRRITEVIRTDAEPLWIPPDWQVTEVTG